MSDLGKIDNIKKIWKFNLACLVLLKAKELKFYFNFSSELWQIEQSGTPLNKVLKKVFNRKTTNALKRLNLFTTVQLIIHSPRNLLNRYRRNRKLVPEYVISGYNSLALSIELPAVSLDKRKKKLVLVENKDNNRKIFKIEQKGKTKILGEHYCNIPLADPNQFEIKKCKGCSGNTAKMIGKVDEEVCTSHFSWNKILGTLPRSYTKEGKRILNWDEKRTSKKFKSELLTNSLNKSLFQDLLPIECLEIELLKKQKLSKALELVLQKSLVRNMESKEQEFFFYMDGSLQLQKENQIGSLTKMGLGWLQLSEDKSYIINEGFARIRNWSSSTRPELAAIWPVVLLAPSDTKLTIYSDSLAMINAITSINRSLAFSQFIKLGNFRT
ncbi:28618_t:CDS:2 [Gigaspora margarita]|uniref:28618_t:CDS:1 n=1 Tax=Gigaspora margarita TaxID=4874 RepID=A0ABN7V5Y2_GIGMA|nr:28618_t:CDS:2 [Gigaspora margarita]